MRFGRGFSDTLRMGQAAGLPHYACSSRQPRGLDGRLRSVGRAVPQGQLRGKGKPHPDCALFAEIFAQDGDVTMPGFRPELEERGLL